jgi:hypothetical protein
MTISNADGVTEFTDLDPVAFHLVPEGATGFPVLLAKAVKAEIDQIRSEERSTTTREGASMPPNITPVNLTGDGRLTDHSAGPFRPVADRHDGSTPENDPFHPLNPLAKAIEQANSAGRFRDELRLRRELAVAKMVASERARAERPGLSVSRHGPGVTALVTNRRSLPDDPSIRYE